MLREPGRLETYATRNREQMEMHAGAKRIRSGQVTLEQVNAYPLSIKLRDGATRLFAACCEKCHERH
jgi:hypothetical protein